MGMWRHIIRYRGREFRSNLSALRHSRVQSNVNIHSLDKYKTVPQNHWEQLPLCLSASDKLEMLQRSKLRRPKYWIVVVEFEEEILTTYDFMFPPSTRLFNQTTRFLGPKENKAFNDAEMRQSSNSRHFFVLSDVLPGHEKQNCTVALRISSHKRMLSRS